MDNRELVPMDVIEMIQEFVRVTIDDELCFVLVVDPRISGFLDTS